MSRPPTRYVGVCESSQISSSWFKNIGTQRLASSGAFAHSALEIQRLYGAIMEKTVIRTRAMRRAQMARMKKARIPTWLSHPCKKDIGRHATTPTSCSCWMCGNPRKWTGERTRQELSAEECFQKIDSPALGTVRGGCRCICDQD